MTEQQLQRKLLRYLEFKGHYTTKVISANKKGVPDIIACVMGRFYGIEVKLPNGKVSELQEYNLEKIKASGGVGVVIRSLDELKELLGDTDGTARS